jgi:hypothetical protein
LHTFYSPEEENQLPWFLCHNESGQDVAPLFVSARAAEKPDLLTEAPHETTWPAFPLIGHKRNDFHHFVRPRSEADETNSGRFSSLI